MCVDLGMCRGRGQDRRSTTPPVSSDGLSLWLPQTAPSALLCVPESVAFFRDDAITQCCCTHLLGCQGRGWLAAVVAVVVWSSLLHHARSSLTRKHVLVGHGLCQPSAPPGIYVGRSLC